MLTHNQCRCDDGTVRSFSPLLLLFLIPVLMFPGAIPGPAVVSADDHLSVHHAFQSEAGGDVRHPHLSDPALQFKALRAAVRTAIQQGEVPLWNPSIWAGAPLMGDAQSMVASPVTWLYLLFGEHHGADLAVVFLLLVAGAGCAALALQLGARSWGAAIAGAGGMTAPFLSVWLLHPHAATAVWWPWLLLALERRSALGLVLATAAILTGGHPQTALHVFALSGLWWILRVRWWGAVYWAIIGLLVAAPVWLPFAEEVSRSATLAHHGGNALAPRQLLDLIWPGWLGHPATETWSSAPLSWADGRLNPGIAILALCIWAAVQRERSAKVILLVWGTGVVLALIGTLGPINNARLASLSALILPVLAGLVRTGRWGPMIWIGVVTTGLWAVRHDQDSLPPERHDPSPAPWTATLRDAVGEGRIIGLDWALQPNTGALVGLSDLRGYDLPVSVDTERLQTSLNPRPVRPWFRIDTLPSLSLLRFAGVRAVVSTTPVEPAIDLGQAPVFARTISDAMPRAWLATSAEDVPSADIALARIISNPRAPARPPVEGRGRTWKGVPLNGSGEVIPVRDLVSTSRTVAFTSSASVGGLAVLADAWHPGWTVNVDGKPQVALRVGGVFRGVRLSPGEHRVEWRFEPWSWRVGCGLFKLSILGAALGLWVRRQRRRSGS